MYKMGEVKTVCRRRRKTDEKRKRGTTVNNNVSLERSESERTRILWYLSRTRNVYFFILWKEGGDFRELDRHENKTAASSFFLSLNRLIWKRRNPNWHKLWDTLECWLNTLKSSGGFRFHRIVCRLTPFLEWISSFWQRSSRACRSHHLDNRLVIDIITVIRVKYQHIHANYCITIRIDRIDCSFFSAIVSHSFSILPQGKN